MSNYEFNPIEKRMETLMTVIDTAILSANNSNDQLMLACAMMQRTREIFDAVLGENGRKEMFKELV
jgi:tetrahydromethanopterin S-methyltransferase subunit E